MIFNNWKRMMILMTEKPIPENLFYIKKIIFESDENEDILVDLIHITKEHSKYLHDEKTLITPETLRSDIREISKEELSLRYQEEFNKHKYIEIKKEISYDELNRILSTSLEVEQSLFEVVESII
jgi:hypothetical protein